MKNTREELDDQIQNMSLTELKEIFEKARTINPPITLGSILEEESESLSLVEEPSVPYGRPSLAEKMQKTGLTKESITRVETNKQKATLEEIIAYCKGMGKSIKDFLPELADE